LKLKTANGAILESQARIIGTSVSHMRDSEKMFDGVRRGIMFSRTPVFADAANACEM